MSDLDSSRATRRNTYCETFPGAGASEIAAEKQGLTRMLPPRARSANLPRKRSRGAQTGRMAPADHSSGLLRAVRWPLLLLAVAVTGILAAFVLDQTPAREYALTIGAPALTIVLPIALGWLAVAAAVYMVRRRREAAG